MASLSRRRALIAVPGLVLLVGLAIGSGLYSCGGGGDDAAPSHFKPPPPPVPGLFPLRVEAGKRHLIDASGKPFLLHIDTAWALIADLSKEDAELYLEDRRQRGFNAVIVNLLERKFSSNAPNNFYGQGPFSTPNDFSTPNPAYFAHADHIVQLAASKGILVLLAPAYLGFNGGDQGWYQVMVANGAAKMRAYGRFLGQRYASFGNILWVHGGDFNPPPVDKPLVGAIALGISDFDGISLHTAHCAPETSALDYWAGESWLDVNTIYTYVDVVTKAKAAYADSTMPFFLFESGYENEQAPVVNEQRARAQAYQAVLSGAMGQAFGNHPIWHFDGPGVFANTVPADWESWLNSAGAMSMVHLRNLLSSRKWWTLVPDLSDSFLLASGAGQFDSARAAKAADGAFALVYVPNSRTLTVNLNQMSGPMVRAAWFDPASGTYTDIGSLPTVSGPRAFTTPGNNSSPTGLFSDWVLSLESTS